MKNERDLKQVISFIRVLGVGESIQFTYAAESTDYYVRGKLIEIGEAWFRVREEDNSESAYSFEGVIVNTLHRIS